jgi:hypothetical protein
MTSMRGAGFWRDAAERVRYEIAHVTDSESKMILLQIADAYERLAQRAEGKSKPKTTVPQREPGGAPSDAENNPARTGRTGGAISEPPIDAG